MFFYIFKENIFKIIFINEIKWYDTTYRKLWITRINAAARMNGLSYSKLMHGLKLAGIEVNRKMLADLAVSDAAAFATLANTAKEAMNK